MAIAEAAVSSRWTESPVVTVGNSEISFGSEFTPFEKTTLELYSRGYNLTTIAKTLGILRETVYGRLFTQQKSVSEKIWKHTYWRPDNADQVTLFAYATGIIPQYGTMRSLWKPNMYSPSELRVMSAIVSGHTTIDDLMETVHFANGTLRTMMPKLYDAAQELTGYRPQNKLGASLIAMACGYISPDIIGSELPALQGISDRPQFARTEQPTQVERFEHLRIVRELTPSFASVLKNLRFTMILPEAGQTPPLAKE